jgi:hypothetical protein
MHIRSKTYLHLLTAWRLLRDAILPRHDDVPAETSPSLIYITVVLALLLAVLEIDAHRGGLESLGLLGGNNPIQAPLFGP